MRKRINPLVLLLALLTTALAGGCQSQSQRSFKSPDDAVTALDTAMRQQDEKELHRIFGPNTDELRTGDPDQDHEDTVVFARKLAAARKLRYDSPDHITLLVGHDEWPFAVPLILKDNKWQFDTEAGLDELTNRRIGRNELLTIQALRTLIDAQAEFFSRDPDGVGSKHYAQRMMSTEGKKDGLYWPAPGGVDPSPIGPVLASAASRRDEKGERIPFNGFLFKLLTKQGPSAPGGAMDYVQDGRLTKGWAAIAYPAVYGETGITSFICSSDGQIYQQDLGEDTSKRVEQIDAYDPDSRWEKLASPAP